MLTCKKIISIEGRPILVGREERFFLCSLRACPKICRKRVKHVDFELSIG